MIKTAGEGRQQVQVGIYQPVGEGQTPDAAVGMAAEGQVRSQTAVPAVEKRVAVGQQQPEGGLLLGIQLRRQFLRSGLVCVAVGIVDPGDEDRLPVSLQRNELVGEHRNAGLPQGCFQFLHGGVAVRPFVVAGHIVGGGNGTEGLPYRLCIRYRGLGVLVHQIAGKEDQVRCCLFHGRIQPLIVLSEFPVVQVAELHDPQPVKFRRQRGGGVGQGIGPQRRIVPIYKQDQQGQQPPPHDCVEPGTGTAAICHGRTSSKM